MRKLLWRRPSAAMLVALTALVSSLAGPAAAEEVARIAQSITSSGQIKNGTVTGADIRNDSVTTNDIRNGSVQTADIGTGQVQTADLAADSVRGDKIPSNTIDGSDIIDESLRGGDIVEGTLGTVPSATSATNASRLDGKSADSFARAASLPTFVVALGLGEEREVTKAGALTLVAQCVDNGGGSATSRLYVKTTAANSMLQGEDTLAGGSDPAANPTDYLQPSTPPADSVVIEESSSSTFPDSSQEIDDGYAIAPDGSYIGVDGEGTALAFNTNGGRCFIAGQSRTHL